MEHYSSDLFSVLDKIAINADLPPIEPVNPGPSTTEPTPPETTSWESKTTGLSNNEIHVDFEQDIPNNGNWDVDCDSGYREVVSAFNCTLSGRVELPIEDDYGQRGFWTDCDSTCKIKYHIQTEDTTFAMRVYQSHSHLTSISFDGMSWDFVQGEGWIDIIQSLNGQTVS